MYPTRHESIIFYEEYIEKKNDELKKLVAGVGILTRCYTSTIVIKDIFFGNLGENILHSSYIQDINIVDNLNSYIDIANKDSKHNIYFEITLNVTSI